MAERSTPDVQGETSVLLAQGDDVSEQRVLKKLYARLLPVGVLIVLFCYMDRGNLGFAANSFCADLKLSMPAYGFGAGLFYVGYSTFQIPSNVILTRLGAPVWLGVIMVFWGIVASAMAFVNSPAQFYVLRVALGFAEAGTFPGLWYHYTIFFPERLQTLPLAVLEMALIMSLPLSSPIAVGLLSLDGWMGISGWRWLFLVEGIFPIFLGVYVFFFWPRNIPSSNFLTSAEKSWLLSNIKSTVTSDALPVDPRQIAVQVVTNLRDVARSGWYWCLVLAAFIRNVGMHVVLYFTTLIVHAFLGDEGNAQDGTDSTNSKTCSVSKSLGLNAVALSAVPFVIAVIASYLVAWISQKTGDRARIAGMTTVICAAFFATFPVLAKLGVVWGFMAYCVGTIACYAPFALLLSLVISHMPLHAKAMGLALFNTMAMLGGFVGPWITGHMVDKSSAESGISTYYGVSLVVGCLMGFGGMLLFFVKDPLQHKDNKPHRIEILEGSSDPNQGSKPL
ncbi:hypothetical protein BSKO_07542 [Bryopsis sp. KO-2023]|nr:hypothetical protein BSKO_07542 [Bryopsis sp. KO-2023]